MLWKQIQCLAIGFRKAPLSKIYFQIKHLFTAQHALNPVARQEPRSSNRLLQHKFSCSQRQSSVLLFGCSSLHKRFNPLQSAGCSRVNPERKFSSSSLHRGRIPPLMEVPPLHLPKISNTIRNTLLSNTLIRPYFDQDFTVKKFVQGAKFAAVRVSENLSCGDLDALEDTCTKQCLFEIKKNLSLFSLKERAELDLTEDDIFYSFLYQIGILMDDEPDESGGYGRQVECTWVGHAFKNYLQIVEEEGGNPIKIKEALEKERGPTILNFRFIRDYSKGVEDSWTINALNYFKLYDV